MAQILAWIGNKYSDAGFNPATIRAQVYGSCTNVPSAQIHRKDTPKILYFEKSNRTYRLQDQDERGQEDVPSVDTVLPEQFMAEDPGDELDGGSTFALEAHLRDYLVLHLSKLEKGLQLWCESPPSVEYVLSGCRVDILAKDISGVPVVVELKLNRGYDRVVGQALLYQGLLEAELGVPRVRIILVAAEITEKLKIAARRQSDIELFEYALTMDVTKISASLD